MPLLILVMSGYGDDKVENLEIQPQNREGKTERRRPFVFLRKLVTHNAVDCVEVADKEK